MKSLVPFTVFSQGIWTAEDFNSICTHLIKFCHFKPERWSRRDPCSSRTRKPRVLSVRGVRTVTATKVWHWLVKLLTMPSLLTIYVVLALILGYCMVGVLAISQCVRIFVQLISYFFFMNQQVFSPRVVRRSGQSQGHCNARSFHTTHGMVLLTRGISRIPPSPNERRSHYGFQHVSTFALVCIITGPTRV